MEPLKFVTTDLGNACRYLYLPGARVLLVNSRALGERLLPAAAAVAAAVSAVQEAAAPWVG